MFTRIKQDLIIGRDMPEMCYQNILITLSKTAVIFSIYLFLKNGLNINLFWMVVGLVKMWHLLLIWANW